MNNRLFVGNLPYPAAVAHLKPLFAKVGLVAQVEILKDSRGRSKGYGFVTMSNQDEAAVAIEKLNGYPLNVSGSERNLHISKASMK
jgi:nucleolin